MLKTLAIYILLALIILMIMFVPSAHALFGYSSHLVMLNFPYVLLSLTVITGAIWLVDLILFKKQRSNAATLSGNDDAPKDPWLLEQAKSFFPIFLIVLIIRSFIGQIYTVPTGSLEPTVIPGDILLVDQFTYGVKAPVWGCLLYTSPSPRD